MTLNSTNGDHEAISRLSIEPSCGKNLSPTATLLIPTAGYNHKRKLLSKETECRFFTSLQQGLTLNLCDRVNA